MSIVLFTSEEEAKKEGYVLLDKGYYGEGKYVKEDETVETEDGEIIEVDDSINTDDGKVYHTDSSDYFYCDHCNNYYSSRVSDYSVITGRNDNETWCSDCTQDNDDCVEVDGDLFSMSEFENRGGHWSDRYDEYTFDDEDEDNGNCLNGYHSDYGNDEEISNASDNLRFGMEFEKMELCGNEGTHKGYRKDGWRTEEDCTVEGEYITPILSLDRVEDSISWIKTTGQRILDASISNRCGGHIHISSRRIDEMTLYSKLKYFMPLFWALYPERAVNSYSNKPTYNSRTALSDYRADIQCHTDIGTTELRIFPGCKGEKTLRFRLMLTKLIVSEAEKWAMEDKNHSLDPNRDKGSFRRAVNFIRTSEELMQVLVQVYDNVEKINALVTRIIPAFNEAIESCSENYKLTSTSVFAKKLEKFCEGKESVNSNP